MQAGPSIIFQGAGEWIAAYPEQEREQILKEEPELLENWDPEFGDRMTELVFIGVDMDQKEMVAGLDPCLLTDEEMNMDWSEFQDQLPAFTVVE